MHFGQAIQVTLLNLARYHVVHIPDAITRRFENDGLSYLGEQLQLLRGMVHDLGLRLIGINGTLSTNS